MKPKENLLFGSVVKPQTPIDDANDSRAYVSSGEENLPKGVAGATIEERSHEI